MGSFMVSYFIDIGSRDLKQICFGIVLLFNFILIVFFGFVDLLRLVSDEGDLSCLVCCFWMIVGESFVLVCVSCGI